MADLTDLETFVAAARTGSFAAAARQLGVTPALVGRRIAALETRYGIRLIERTTRSQRMTETGARFLDGAENVIAAAQELDDVARPTGKLRGRVRLSGPTTLGITRLAALVAGYCDAHPGVTVELQLSDRRVDLVGEGFDLAVRVGNLPPSGLIARRIGVYGFTVCAAPAFLAAHPAPTTPAGLATARCILNLNFTPRDQWVFFGPGGGAPVVAEVAGDLQCDNDVAQRAAAIAGAGIAYLPADLVRDDIAAGSLVPVLSQWGTVGLPIHAVYPSRRFIPRHVSAMIETLAAGPEMPRSPEHQI